MSGRCGRARERHSPIAGILLTNGDLDHCLGLLSLRESHPLVVYATDAVRAGFTEGNVLYRTLERFPGQVDLAAPRARAASSRSGGSAASCDVTAIPAPGKLPLHLEGPARPPSPEDNVGFVIRDARAAARLAYFSGVAGPSPEVERALADADVVFFDGTFWSSDELIAAGLGHAHAPRRWRTGRSAGPAGACSFCRGRRGRTIYIHVNNTNPILREDSPERRAVADAGVEVAARRPGAGAVSGRARRCCRPTSSSRACATEGTRRYHDQHPFHQLMHAGKLTRDAARRPGR